MRKLAFNLQFKTSGVKIYKDSNLNEYQCEFSRAGQRVQEADYFTDDCDGILGAGGGMIRRELVLYHLGKRICVAAKYQNPKDGRVRTEVITADNWEELYDLCEGDETFLERSILWDWTTGED